jgi:hypothetical protein
MRSTLASLVSMALLTGDLTPLAYGQKGMGDPELRGTPGNGTFVEAESRSNHPGRLDCRMEKPTAQEQPVLSIG